MRAVKRPRRPRDRAWYSPRARFPPTSIAPLDPWSSSTSANGPSRPRWSTTAPPQSGKTTNLEQIHRLTDPAGTNRLISLNTAQDRTLFFDLLPFSLGAVSGYDFQVQLYTVPGQVQYNATRRVVLAGADAVVFVADSRRRS